MSGPMQRVTVNGVETAFEETGAEADPARPPLVFVHGAVQTLRVWDAQVAHFAGAYRCIAYDLRGHGATPLGDRDLTIPLLADDLLALLDALGLERAVVCGVSLGGMAALHAAARAPSRLAALALANTPVALSTSPALLKLLDWTNPYALLRPVFAAIGQRRAAELGLALAARLVGPGWVSEKAREHFVRGFSTMPAPAVLATYRAITQAGIPTLRSLDAPALLVVGEAEARLVLRHAEEIAKRLGRAEIVTIPGGHVTNLDAPDAFNAALAAFLANAR